MKKTIVVLCLMLITVSGSAMASGLAIPEQGAAALGMSAAMTARSEDLSAIYYNPAGLEYVQGFEIYTGITPIMPGHSFSPFSEDKKTINGLDAESNVFLPPQLYAAWRASSKVVLGIGVYAPFGLGTEWDDTWNGRYSSTFAEIQTVYVNPTVAVTVTDKLSLGFGASYITSNATIEKMIDTGAALGIGTNTALDSHFGLEGDASAWSMNAGLMYHPKENLHLGVSYRWAYELEYDGDAMFTHKDALKLYPYPLIPGATLFDVMSGQMPAKQSGTATLKMPSMLNFGALFNINEQWDTSVDVDLVGWGDYTELAIDFDDDKPADKSVQEKDWENTFTLRSGTSYKYSEKTTLRFGFMYDTNPVPEETMDPQLPDSDRIGLSIGAGYKLGKVRIDAGYMLLNFMNREKDNGVGFSRDLTGDGEINRFDVDAAGGYPVGNGDYESRAHLFSVAASMAF